MTRFYEIGGKEIHVRCFRKGTSSAYTGDRHYLYKLCVSVCGHQVFLKYHDTRENYVSGAWPDIDAALHQIIGFAYDFEDGRDLRSFAAALGRGIDDAMARDFRDCRKSFYKLRAVLSAKDIEMFYEMTR